MLKFEYQFQDEEQESDDEEVQNASRDEHLCKVRTYLLSFTSVICSFC